MCSARNKLRSSKTFSRFCRQRCGCEKRPNGNIAHQETKWKQAVSCALSICILIFSFKQELSKENVLPTQPYTCVVCVCGGTALLSCLDNLFKSRCVSAFGFSSVHAFDRFFIYRPSTYFPGCRMKEENRNVLFCTNVSPNQEAVQIAIKAVTSFLFLTILRSFIVTLLCLIQLVKSNVRKKCILNK